MNRRKVLISSATVVLVLAATTLVILTICNVGTKVTVAFVNAEHSNGKFPDYIPSERLAFDVHNAGSKPASVDVFAIEDEGGNWVRSLHVLGEVKEGKTVQYYLYLPPGSHPRSLRMRVHEDASTLRKGQVALKLLIAKVAGRYQGAVWHDRLKEPVDELIVKTGEEAGHSNHEWTRMDTNL